MSKIKWVSRSQQQTNVFGCRHRKDVASCISEYTSERDGIETEEFAGSLHRSKWNYRQPLHWKKTLTQMYRKWVWLNWTWLQDAESMTNWTTYKEHLSLHMTHETHLSIWPFFLHSEDGSLPINMYIICSGGTGSHLGSWITEEI